MMTANETTLRGASRQLLTRPPDEQFYLADLRQVASRERAESTERALSPRAVLFGPSEVSAFPLIDVGDGVVRRCTRYAAEQVARACGTSVEFLARLKPETGARALNEAFDRDQTDRKALISPEGTLRAFTSKAYERLWDAEILDAVDRWVLPLGWIPAVPTFRSRDGQNAKGNDKPALFRGDRDSFMFFYSPQTGQDGLGGFRRGFLLGNSEVGARSFYFDTFQFRDVCGNFLIWGASDVRRHRAVHRKGVRDLFREFNLMLRDYSQRQDAEFLRRMEAAARENFGATPEKRVQRLTRGAGLSEKTAEAVLSAARLPENAGPHDAELGPSTFAVINGATWQAHQEAHAEDRVEWARVGQRILATVGA